MSSRTDRTQIEGVDYSPEAIERARRALITVRNDALEREDPAPAAFFSHIIAYLWDYRALLLQDREEPLKPRNPTKQEKAE